MALDRGSSPHGVSPAGETGTESSLPDSVTQEKPRELTRAESELLNVWTAAHNAIEFWLIRAHQGGVDIGDLLGGACQDAARAVGDDLTRHRRGSWEATHVRALSAGWDWDLDAERAK
jgi:hypothetical protein